MQRLETHRDTVAGEVHRSDAALTEERFTGPIVHPQQWPADLDHTGKRVVVIGSGATAMTLVPAMAPDAEHVKMLQRSPTYVLSVPEQDPVARGLRRVLPDRAAEVSEKRKVPFYSLILMLLPAVGLSAVYAYNSTFVTYTYDATLVIAVTFLFTAIAVVLLPFLKKDLWRASPARGRCSPTTRATTR